MDCMVTGGAGFIGSHIVDALVAQGRTATVFDDLSSGNAANLSEKTVLKVGDVRDKQAVGAVLSGSVDCVFHLAAQIDVRRAVQDPGFDAQVNICLLYTSPSPRD